MKETGEHEALTVIAPHPLSVDGWRSESIAVTRPLSEQVGVSGTIPVDTTRRLKLNTIDR